MIVWKLTPVEVQHEGFTQRPGFDQNTGAVVPMPADFRWPHLEPSAQCPLCTQTGVHSHGRAELEWLRWAAFYLESKLGIVRAPDTTSQQSAGDTKP